MKEFFKSLSRKKALLSGASLTLVLGLATVGCVGCKEPEPDPTPTPQPEPTTYEVSFETNGGTAISPVTVEEGATVVVNDYTTTKTDYYFYGWCLDKELTERASATVVVNADLKLYAEWGETETYLLSFETGEGSAIEAVRYEPKAYLAKPEDPTRENYVFGGWYKDEACTKEISFYGAQMPAKDLTVYAKWNVAHGIIFDTKGGSAVESIFGETGEPVDAPAAPTKDGYAFEGWYLDEAYTQPYEIVTIPNKVLTVYAKWHEKATDISVTLHVNFGDLTSSAIATGDEGEALDLTEAIATFSVAITASIQDRYLGDASTLTAKPIYNFSAWAFDANGKNRFDGTLPHAESLELYAIWSRSAAYCQVSFLEGETETAYFVDKNKAIEESVFDAYANAAKEQYEAIGCEVDGFYTTGGNRYAKGDLVAMDMRLTPYVYSADLVYEYAENTTPKGAKVKGYELKGYDSEVAEEMKAKESLLLLVPEFYNDGTHGQLPVIWVADNAFAEFPVSSATLPKSVLGIGAEAFKATKLTEISLPSDLYFLGDNAFSGSAALATIEFDSSKILKLGSTVFAGTAYEDAMPVSLGFKFFDKESTIIYGYVGTAKTLTTPSSVVTIAGGAFRGNDVVNTLTLHDNLRTVGDYAFAESALVTVNVGKSFASMGTGVFKDCLSLKSVKFASAYNLSYLGESLFEGCSALVEVNVSKLQNLQTIGDKTFFGCSSLQAISFSNSLTTLGASAFESCTSLVYADFGTSDASAFATLSDRAFAGCTSLRRIIFRGELVNNQTVKFGAQVFDGAGYTKNSAFVAPVVYVKDKWVDNWSVDDDFKTASYVDIYEAYFARYSEYSKLVVKAIDSKAPSLTINGVLELTTSTPEIAAFDLLAFFTERGVYGVSDDVSYATDCTVYIKTVTTANGATVPSTDGKYNLSAAGTYQAVLVAEDEFGNVAEASVTIVVS